MTKERKIIEAYGKYWESIKDFVDENGYIIMSISITRKINLELEREIRFHSKNTSGVAGMCVRPKTLQGLENNNGWVKIESIEDLPKEKGLKCLFLNKDNMHTTYISDDVLYDSDWFFRRYTHWKIKNEFKYPLY